MTHLMIRDLEASRELDTHAMQTIRGGMSVPDLTAINAQMLSADAKAGLVAIATATQTLVGVNTLLDLDISPQTNISIGGIS